MNHIRYQLMKKTSYVKYCREKKRKNYELNLFWIFISVSVSCFHMVLKIIGGCESIDGCYDPTTIFLAQLPFGRTEGPTACRTTFFFNNTKNIISIRFPESAGIQSSAHKCMALIIRIWIWDISKLNISLLLK